MNTALKLEQSNQAVSSNNIGTKKEKIGRWSSAECYFFQCLLQRYGKNWKKIQQHMKNRSLSQIRSHAQKYFDKIGTKKVQEFQRKAKLLEAYETLQKEKQLREQIVEQNSPNQLKPETDIIYEEQSPLTAEDIQPKNSQQSLKESIYIKEQIKPSESLQSQKLQNTSTNSIYPFLNNFNPFNGGFLLQIIGQNPGPFFQYRGIQPYIDNPEFRASVFKSIE